MSWQQQKVLHLTKIHNADILRNMTYHRQIMRNKHIGQVFLFLQILHQIQDLSPYRHIQCKNRFIANDKRRVQYNGTGDTDSLLSSSIQLMG